MRIKATIIALIILQTLIGQSQLLNDTRESLQLVNTVYDELNPVISPDGRTLFMTIANHPSNVGGKRDPGDIWFSVLTENDQWSTPVHAGPLLNDRAYNGIAGFSAEGNEMFLLSHYNTDGNPAHTQGIAVSRNTGNGWAKPENISIPYFQNKSNTLFGYLSPDKSCFIFSAETYGTHGVEDLYISLKKTDGNWSEPKNLGPRINTQFQELSPSLSADGMTLYFSSNGRKGSGSFDVYSATRLDNTWMNWSEPANMGTGVNSEGRELFYKVYPQLGVSIFTSTKNSDGYGDIKISRQDKPFPIDSTATAKNTTVGENSPAIIKIAEQNPARADHKIITVHGRVTNAKNGESINARITFESPGNNIPIIAFKNPIKADATTGYTTGIPSTNNYSITIEADGFISVLEKLDIKTYEMKDLEMNFKLQPIEVGTTVNLRNVLFEQSKTNLLPESHAELDLVVAFLKANSNVKIELGGHTDNRGIPSQNIKLSQARVDKVKSYLVSKGIEPKRIYGKGYGGSKPIASNDTEETRQLNRRVEFTIKKF